MAELVSNLSMADISSERRPAFQTSLCESVTRFLKDRYPASDGYHHQAITFAPFKKLPKLLGHRVWVKKGMLWGYRIELIPGDSQRNTVRVQLTRFLPLNELFALCSIVPAFALIVGLQICVVGNWLAWKDYRDPVLILLVPSVVLGAALFATMKCLAWPFVALKTDKKQIAEETAALRQSLHGVVVKGETPVMPKRVA